MGDWLGAHIEGDLRRAGFEIEFKIRSRSLVQNLESSLERHGRRSSVDVLEGAVRDGWMVPVVLVCVVLVCVVLVCRTRVCRTRVSYSCVWYSCVVLVCRTRV